MPPVARRWKIFVLVVLVSLVADQATKVWARDSLPVHPASCEVPEDIVAHRCYARAVKVIDGYWDWQLSFNPGASFSLFKGQAGARVFLSVIAALAMAGMVWMVKKSRPDQRVLHWALALTAGGALGNLIDRVRFGYVIDFVALGRWPNFNVADAAISVGVVCLAVDALASSAASEAPGRGGARRGAPHDREAADESVRG